MKKLSILSGLVILLFFTACLDKTAAQEIKLLTPQEYQDAITTNEDVQLVDVRTPEEFAEGHLENALNIDFLESDFITEVEKLDLKKPIYIYCRSGKRSGRAALVLKDVGFSEIYDLQGGFLNWEKNEFQAQE